MTQPLEDLLFLGTRGHVLALDPLSGLGHGLICLTTARLGAASGFTELAAAHEEAAPRSQAAT